MIDLGIELAGYGDEEPARPPRPGQPRPTPVAGGGGTYPLADLQAAGFNIDPAAVAMARDPLNAILGIPIVRHRQWLPGDDEPSVGLFQQSPGGGGAGGSWQLPDPPSPAPDFNSWFGSIIPADQVPPWLKLHTDEGDDDGTPRRRPLPGGDDE